MELVFFDLIESDISISISISIFKDTLNQMATIKIEAAAGSKANSKQHSKPASLADHEIASEMGRGRSKTFLIDGKPAHQIAAPWQEEYVANATSSCVPMRGSYAMRGLDSTLVPMAAAPGYAPAKAGGIAAYGEMRSVAYDFDGNDEGASRFNEDHFSSDERLNLLALSLIENAGPVTLRQLIEQYGSASEAFRLCRLGVLPRFRIKAPILDAIIRGSTQGAADAELRKAEMHGIEVLTFQDPKYPKLLNEANDGPLVLYKKGVGDLNYVPTISIVGTRKPSELGIEIANEFGTYFASKGFNIVSGLAYGIDATAHRAALRNGGVTTAVLGHGIDTIYPSQHRGLAANILDCGGALISDFPVGTKPDAFNFPARNRIIAGMAHATLVIEAQEKGGALITARMAFDQNRLVFAIPGSIGKGTSVGCNMLIRDCIAKLVLSPDDIVNDLIPVLGSIGNSLHHKGTMPGVLASEPLSSNGSPEMQLMKVLKGRELMLDEIQAQIQIEAKELMNMLLKMEMKGIVSNSAGRYSAY